MESPTPSHGEITGVLPSPVLTLEIACCEIRRHSAGSYGVANLQSEHNEGKIKHPFCPVATLHHMDYL